jgi:hypothetical protein
MRVSKTPKTFRVNKPSSNGQPQSMFAATVTLFNGDNDKEES